MPRDGRNAAGGRRAALVLSLVTGLVVALGVAIPAIATHVDDDCDELGGTIVLEVCVVNTDETPGPGPFTLSHPLTITGSGSITSPGGITLNINGEADLDLIMQPNSLIDAGDPVAPPDAAAGDITINVSGDVVMQANSTISAVNSLAGGGGGDIEIDVEGDMSMAAGATITSDKGGGGGGNAGDITIDVGNFPLTPPTGSFVMAAGSVVRANATGAAGSAGDIAITAGFDAQIDGQVLSEQNQGSTGSGGGRDGASIFISAGCGLRIGESGVVSSQGQDQGADLVHLEACEVTIAGLVQSRGAGHGTPDDPPNLCDGDFRPGKDEDATGCIEVWGRLINITNTAELNADINDVGAGGSDGSSWIDLFADRHITIDGPTGVDDPFAVHADSYSGSDDTPNTITVKSVNGTVTASGKALSASCSEDLPHTGDPPCNGSNGGALVVEASGTVDLDGATLWAKGDDIGTLAPCESGSGACGDGGTIDVRSFNANVTWQNGVGDVSPDDGVSPPAGDIDLVFFTTVNTTGSSFGDAGADTMQNLAGGVPSLPSFVQFRLDLWGNCQPPPPCPTPTTTATATSTAPPVTTTATETATSTAVETTTVTVTEIVTGTTVSGTATETVTSTAPAVTGTTTVTVTSTAAAGQFGDVVAACTSCTGTMTITDPPECTTTTTTVTTPTTGTTVTTTTVSTLTTTETTRTVSTSTHTTGTTTTVTTVTTPSTQTTTTVTTVTTPTTETTTRTTDTGTTTTRTTDTGSTTTRTTSSGTTTTRTPTTRTPTTRTTDPGGTTVRPTTGGGDDGGGPAFTGVENIVRLAAIALLLLTVGSALLWVGSRRRRHASGD